MARTGAGAPGRKSVPGRVLLGVLGLVAGLGAGSLLTQERCTQQMRNFYIRIATGSECEGAGCDPSCQKLIKQSLDTCAGFKIPNTMVDFLPEGIEQMRHAVDLKGQTSDQCDWSCKRCKIPERRSEPSKEAHWSAGDAEQAWARKAGLPIPPARPRSEQLAAIAKANAADEAETARVKAAEEEAARVKATEEAAKAKAKAAEEEASKVKAAKGREAKAETAGVDCRDTQEDCAGWAEDGECAANQAFMLASCCESCSKQSKLAGTEGCRDKEADCAAWAGDGECAANPAFMLPSCCESCMKKLAADLARRQSHQSAQEL